MYSGQDVLRSCDIPVINRPSVLLSDHKNRIGKPFSAVNAVISGHEKVQGCILQKTLISSCQEHPL